MSKNKLCIISQYFPPDTNGDVVRLLNSLKILKKLNLDIVVVTAFPHYPDGIIPLKYKRKFFVREGWDGIEIERTFVLPLPHKGFLNRFLLYSSFAASSSMAVFLVEDVSTVWAFSQRFFSFISGIFFKLVHKSELIMDMTDVWPEAIVNTDYLQENSLVFKLVKSALYIIFRMSNRITTLTIPMKKMIASRGIQESKIEVIPNIAHFKTNKLMFQKLNDRLVLMYSGNLGSNYDFKTVLEAAKKLRDEHIQFIIRGRGEKESFISEFIRKNDLKNIFLDTLILPEDQMVEYLMKADVFLLPMKDCPYPDASLPIKLLDYLSCGKPIIALSEGFLKEILEKNKAGLVTSPENIDSLVDNILKLKNNPRLREEMGYNAFRCFKEQFSQRILEQKIKKLLKL